MELLDFVAIGDTTVDEFIKLENAEVHCNINNDECTISMSWGDKLPYEFSVAVPGVGNAANAAVAASRLGLKSGFISNVGKDRYGEEIIEYFKSERVETEHVRVNDGLKTNHHYVLWYNAERTILIKHEDYPYEIPNDFAPPKWIYLSSAGKNSAEFHGKLAEWMRAHPETKLAFQPGTFQMEMGKDKLAPLYQTTELVACNKEEAERILELPETDIKELLQKMRNLGPKVAIITDGPNGGYAYDGEKMLKVPMYPDIKPPLDRTGAGDATTSTIVAALALGKPLHEALLWGPINAAGVVLEIGAQKGLFSREVLEDYLKKAPEGYKIEQLGAAEPVAA